MQIKFIRNFSLAERRRVYSIINKINKNVNEKKWQCLVNNCNEPAINSHVLQKNNVLTTIAEHNHVYKLSTEIGGTEEDIGKAKFERVGINEAIVYPLFCKTHDRELFKEIEMPNFNPYGLQEQLLFTYRALCCEVHKKRAGVEYYQRIINSITLDWYLSKEYAYIGKRSFSLGLKDCEYFKEELEIQLADNFNNKFYFETLEYPIVKLSASAIFSPLSDTDHYLDFSPFKNVYISIIPNKMKTFIILGYHNTYVNKWIKDYIAGWKNLTQTQLELKLSDLIASRTEAFCLAPHVVQKMNPDLKKYFLKYWEMNGFNLSERQYFPYNIFE